MPLSDHVRAVLALSLLYIVLLPAFAAAAVPPTLAEGRVRAVLLELPPWLRDKPFVVALLTPHGPVPLPAVPAPLKKLNTSGVEALAWSPEYRFLLVLVPPGLAGSLAAPRPGENGLAAVYRVPGVGTVGIYALDMASREALKTIAALYMPFIGPLNGNTSLSYTVTWGGGSYSLSINPTELAMLAERLTPVKPAASIPEPRRPGPATALAREPGAAGTVNGYTVLVPYLTPIEGMQPVRALEWSGAGRWSTGRCWKVRSFPMAPVFTAGASVKSTALAQGRVRLAVYPGSQTVAPIAVAEKRGWLLPGHTWRLLARLNVSEWWTGPGRTYTVCLYVDMFFRYGSSRAVATVAAGGYRLVTLQKLWPNSRDMTYIAARDYGLVGDSDTIETWGVTLPVPLAPVLAPGPLSVFTRLRSMGATSVTLRIGDTVVKQATLRPGDDQFVSGSLWGFTALHALENYLLYADTAPLQIHLNGRAELHIDYTEVDYTAIMTNYDADAPDVAGPHTGIVGALPASTVLLKPEPYGYSEAGSVALQVFIQRPVAGTPYRLRVDSNLLIALKDRETDVELMSTWLSIDGLRGTPSICWARTAGGGGGVYEYAPALLWAMGALGTGIGIIATAGSAGEALALMLSITATVLSEPHVASMLGPSVEHRCWVSGGELQGSATAMKGLLPGTLRGQALHFIAEYDVNTNPGSTIDVFVDYTILLSHNGASNSALLHIEPLRTR